MLVNTRPIARKVSVNGERRLHRTTAHHLLSDLLLQRLHSVHLAAKALVLLVADRVLAVVARARAPGRPRLALARRTRRTVRVVLARLHGIGLAALAAVVQTAGADALVFEVLPGHLWVAAVAAEAAELAAGDHVLGGQVHVLGGV